jgi:four helix bundle protein
MRPYEDLLAWRKAHALTLEVYRLTQVYPSEERFGLTAQTRRSVSSVPGNVAEGCGKRSRPQLRHHIDIACGSLSELEYWLLLARDLGYLEADAYTAVNEDVNEVRRLLLGFAAWSVS